METLQDLVRNLIIILLLAMVLEMILPSKSMRGFVQLVMGLFVISAILSPLTTLLKLPLEMEIPAWTVTEADMPVLATDQVGEELGRNAVEEQYRLILVRQIRSLALGVEGVQEAEVEVEFEEDGEGLANEPKLKVVTIELTIGSTESVVPPIEPVAPINIGQGPAEVNRKQSLVTEEVQERVAVFMEIPPEKVVVWEN